MRLAGWWRFLLQWLNRVTSPLHLFQPQEKTELILSSKCPVGDAGGRWICLCFMWHFRQPYAI